ncbi:MAG TPA: molybdenum cofactor guanylyltransferase [Anaerolineae bacterium]|nr:molybdenum cofactor guanylyltransferase [Anaerolineae bacterium]HQK14988.1 molybdenum cofactor guanylyltransferase [Anaerolineae bacterium]
MQKMMWSGIVLAGGSSTRMGMDKRFMTIHAQPLVVWVIERLRALVDEVIVAALDPAAFDSIEARVVTDVYPGQGVLAGLHAGLAAAQSEWAIAVAGDMPLLNPVLLRAMMRLAQGSAADIIVPQWQGNLEPLHALYRPAACAPAAEAALRAGKRRIIAFYPDVRVHIMSQDAIAQWDPEGRSFFNVNTPDDWALALQQLSEPTLSPSPNPSISKPPSPNP